MIAIVPSTSGSQDEYHVLYVVENNTESDKKASPATFKTLTVSNPPEQLVHDFSPNGETGVYNRMTTGDPQNFHVMVSTGSGTGQGANVWEQLLKPFLDLVGGNAKGEEYQLHFTASESSISDFTRTVLLPQANAGVAQSLVLLSGDGGLVDVANTLLSEPRSRHYQKPSIAILPLGTGNALAHSSGITKDKTLGLSALVRGSPEEIPLFSATFSPGARLLANEAREELELPTHDNVPTCHGAVVCSWGLHAGLVADSDTAHYRQFGAERFGMAAKEALYPADGSLPHAYRGTVSILRSGSEEWVKIDRTEHAYVLATLVSQLERGFHISPASQPLDGKLRLIDFGPMSGDEAMQLMTGAYQGGKHVEDERVSYQEILGLRIEFDEQDARWRRVCVDGKIVRVEQGGRVEVKNGVGEGLVDLIAI
jgi:diacylglycerol kinase family enzyme